ncbi:hypothetical protein NDU88_006959 [Pleurodeles waltl]|uniref:Uncharacterized protein n=1 Tax=Pleurodeles waltl TaxID=8319 RepID=A0AAV7QKK4_PLEWA|nr:hypothetical protein NDU88_006959 [Pleurodeles waltl]
MRIPRGTPPGWPPGLDHQRKAKRGESEGRDLLETGSQEPQLRFSGIPNSRGSLLYCPLPLPVNTAFEAAQSQPRKVAVK